MRNRAFRRWTNERKWTRRVKKLWKCYHWFEVPIKGIRSSRISYTTGETRRRATSMQDYMRNSIEAKVYKTCTVPYRNKQKKITGRINNRRDRHRSREVLKCTNFDDLCKTPYNLPKT